MFFIVLPPYSRTEVNIVPIFFLEHQVLVVSHGLVSVPTQLIFVMNVTIFIANHIYNFFPAKPLGVRADLLVTLRFRVAAGVAGSPFIAYSGSVLVLINIGFDSRVQPTLPFS